MNTLRRQAKIMRRKVLLSALEEARFAIKAGIRAGFERDHILAKLDQEIAWVKIRIERLEDRK